MSSLKIDSARTLNTGRRAARAQHGAKIQDLQAEPESWMHALTIECKHDKQRYRGSKMSMLDDQQPDGVHPL